MGCRCWPLKCFLDCQIKPFMAATLFPQYPMEKSASPIFARRIWDITEESVLAGRAPEGFGNSLKSQAKTEKYGIAAGASGFRSRMNLHRSVYLGKSQRNNLIRKWGEMNRIPKFPMPAHLGFCLRLCTFSQEMKELSRESFFFYPRKWMGGNLTISLRSGFSALFVDGRNLVLLPLRKEWGWQGTN